VQYSRRFRVPRNFARYINAVYNRFPLKTITPFFACWGKRQRAYHPNY
jgi:hypothetical protein